jgi:hypothetical protein
MKPDPSSPFNEGGSLEPESAAFAAWYATHSAVRPVFDGAATDADGVIVTTLSWRDPTST